MAKKKGFFGTQAKIAGGVLVLMLAAHGSKGFHGIHADLDAIGGAGQYTPVSWARTVLRADGLPRTACDMNAMTAWIGAEGSDRAWHNLLDSTQREPGSTSVNSVGVQAYTSWHQGLKATVVTLNNGLYSGILSALQAGDNAQAVADAVSASPWGTEPFQANC